MLRPVSDAERTSGQARRRARVVIAAAALVGVFTGLLANGGGFLLVPLYLVILGLGMRQSAATSLVVIAALSVPTLVTHWALGDIDWAVAAAFAAGAVPGALLGGRAAHRVTGDTVRRAFGVLLVTFAVYFTARQATGG